MIVNKPGSALSYQDYKQRFPGSNLCSFHASGQLNYAKFLMPSEKSDFSMPGTETFRVGAVLGGNSNTGICSIEDHRFSKYRHIPGESCTLVPAGHSMAGSWFSDGQENGPLMTTVMLAPHKLSEFILNDLDREPNSVHLVPRAGETDVGLASIINAIGSAIEDGSADNQLYLDALIIALLTRLMVKHSSADFKPQNYAGSLSANTIRQVRDYINEYYTDPISLSELATLTGISASHLCREFAKATGQTPHQYLEAVRLTKATQLLSNSSLNVTDIAMACGYSHSRFATVFKRRHGVSPREYRRSIK